MNEEQKVEFDEMNDAKDTMGAAHYLNRSYHTIVKWRAKGIGPNFYRSSSNRCLYLNRDLASYKKEMYKPQGDF